MIESKEFRDKWELERQAFIKGVMSDKYPCEVDYTCQSINYMQELIREHVKDEGIQKILLERLERVRQSNVDLRDWGHDLRYILLKKEHE